MQGKNYPQSKCHFSTNFKYYKFPLKRYLREIFIFLEKKNSIAVVKKNNIIIATTIIISRLGPSTTFTADETTFFCTLSYCRGSFRTKGWVTLVCKLLRNRPYNHHFQQHHHLYCLSLLWNPTNQTISKGWPKQNLDHVSHKKTPIFIWASLTDDWSKPDFVSRSHPGQMFNWKKDETHSFVSS